MKNIFIILVFITTLFSKNIKTNNSHDAIILLYHHVADNTPISTSATIKQFKNHMQYLNKNNYKVIPLEDILNKIKNKEKIAEKSVAISFDDSYISVYKNAYPILKKYNYPFTVFVNTSPISRSKLYTTWEQLKEMMEHGATIGAHSHYHEFLIRESYEYVYNDLKKSHNILKGKLGIDATMFAYPFGEYTQDLEDIVTKFGYFGLTQKSGAVNLDTNLLEVPRFPLSSFYANMDRFELILNSKALNPNKREIPKKIIKQSELENFKVSYTFKNTNDLNTNTINCFDGMNGNRIEISKNNFNDKTKIEFFLPKTWSVNRQKINCTAPSINNKNSYYWYSELFYITSNDNKWYNF